MSRIVSRRIASIVAMMMFVGCQTGMKSPAPSAKATAAERSQHASATGNANELSAFIELPTAAAAKAPPNTANTDGDSPHVRIAFYRADAKPAAIPRVLLSKRDEAACKVKVGDAMPAIELPKLGGNGRTKMADLFGKKATVVVFWKSDRRMSQQLLVDLRADVVEPFGKQGVAVVGVAVDASAKVAEATFKKSGANFPNLHDADGKAFALVGSERFPRTYVLDASGKIVWFDIEYSLATRRELHQALRAIAGGK